jgi:LysR family positive regulator for ilvC
LDHDALRLFLQLSRTLHFGRASRECHVSPSALSRAVQRLEAEVGFALFERDRRSVALTPQGELFRTYAAESLQSWHALHQRLSRSAERLTGSVAIFASVTACQTFLPPLLSAFRGAHPEVQIKLETGYAADALDMLAEGRVDVAVAAIASRIPKALAARVILETPLVFVAPASACESSQLVERRPIPWTEVPMVLPATGPARVAADRWFLRRRIRPRIYSEVSGNEAILSLVSLGCGIGLVPRLVADRSPLRPELSVLDVEPGPGVFRVGVCAQRKRLEAPVVRAFWTSIEEGLRSDDRLRAFSPRR